jgi:steroid 5-alpha reductase family enzyme
VVANPGLGDLLLVVLVMLLVARLSVHEKRRWRALSTDERIEVITEKVRNPVRYRLSATVRWLLG